MRLALLKNNSCQCNGNSKDKVAASNQSDDMVRHFLSLLIFKTLISAFCSIRSSIVIRKTQTAHGKRLTRRTRPSQSCGFQTMLSHDVKVVKLSSGWGDGSITADVVVRYFVATAVSTLHLFQRKAF